MSYTKTSLIPEQKTPKIWAPVECVKLPRQYSTRNNTEVKRKRVRNYSSQLQTKIKKSLAKRLKNKDQIIQTDHPDEETEHQLIQRQTLVQSRFKTIPENPVKLTRPNVTADASVTRLPRVTAPVVVDDNQIDSEELENEFSYNMYLNGSNQSFDVHLPHQNRSNGNKIEIKRSMWRMSPACENILHDMLTKVDIPVGPVPLERLDEVPEDTPNVRCFPHQQSSPNQHNVRDVPNLDVTKTGPLHSLGTGIDNKTGIDIKKYPNMLRALQGKVKFSLQEGQLLKQVYLVNKMLRYHKEHADNTDCPICLGENELFSSSSNTGGLGDMNIDHFIFGALREEIDESGVGDPLPSFRAHKHLSPPLCMSCCHREAHTRNRNMLGDMPGAGFVDRQIQSGEPQLWKCGESYFESFLNLSLFPESYTFHVRTDIVLSVAIVFAFLAAQYLFTTSHSWGQED